MLNTFRVIVLIFVRTALHSNTFRYYALNTGSFTQPDPIGLAGGYNLYQYAHNALMWIDPYGLCRRGNQKTKDHMDKVRDKFLSDNLNVKHTDGGPQGGSYADVAFETHMDKQFISGQWIKVIKMVCRKESGIMPNVFLSKILKQL